MDGMPWTVIFFFLPLYIVFILLFLAILGCVWAPMGAFIAYRIARKKEERPMRHAFVAAIYSVLFILPLVSLIVPSRFRSLATVIVIICAYVTWLIGPLGYLLVSIEIESFSGKDKNLLTAILVVMGLTWIAALIWTIQSQVRHAHKRGLLQTYRVVIPSAGLWVSVVVCIMAI